MRKSLLRITFLSLFASVNFANGQVGVGTSSPDGSSVLDVSSNNKGVLIPRMTEAERNAIPDPANGLLIYNTSVSKKGLEFYRKGVGAGGTSNGWYNYGCQAAVEKITNIPGAQVDFTDPSIYFTGTNGTGGNVTTDGDIVRSFGPVDLTSLGNGTGYFNFVNGSEPGENFVYQVSSNAPNDYSATSFLLRTGDGTSGATNTADRFEYNITSNYTGDFTIVLIAKFFGEQIEGACFFSIGVFNGAQGSFQLGGDDFFRVGAQGPGPGASKFYDTDVVVDSAYHTFALVHDTSISIGTPGRSKLYIDGELKANMIDALAISDVLRIGTNRGRRSYSASSIGFMNISNTPLSENDLIELSAGTACLSDGVK